MVTKNWQIPEIHLTEISPSICGMKLKVRSTIVSDKKKTTVGVILAQQKPLLEKNGVIRLTQPAITCSKFTKETLEHGVKYAQS